jgi:hypothetical protein
MASGSPLKSWFRISHGAAKRGAIRRTLRRFILSLQPGAPAINTPASTGTKIIALTLDRTARPNETDANHAVLQVKPVRNRRTMRYVVMAHIVITPTSQLMFVPRNVNWGRRRTNEEARIPVLSLLIASRAAKYVNKTVISERNTDTRRPKRMGQYRRKSE